MAKLEPPIPKDVEFLRSWFDDIEKGNYPLLGLDKDAWGGSGDDLVAMKARVAPDPFSSWVSNTVIPFYHNLLGDKLKVWGSSEMLISSNEPVGG